MPAMGTLFATWDGRVTERMIEYYRQRAKGGAGLIVVEYAYVHASGQVYNGQLAVDRDQTIKGLRSLAEAIKGEGAVAALQLMHGGRICFPEIIYRTPIAPSALATLDGALPKAMDCEDITIIKQAFADAAIRAQQAGFDLVELHMAHGYLIHSFLSPYANNRTDFYGGDLANRARFALETLGKVQEAVDDNLEILCKISGCDYISGGIESDSIQIFSQWLEEAGAAALTVSGGTKNETDHMVTPPMSVPPAFRVQLAESVKERVSIPVATVGRIHNPLLAAQIVSKRHIDLVATGRAFLADPDWPSKTADDRIQEICPCIACNQGCIGRIMRGLPISCLSNPALGREHTFIFKPSPRKQTVVVVGGGPGGMSSARALKLKGHHVVLFEKSDVLGGRLAIAAQSSYKKEIINLLKYLESELRRLNVDIRINSPLTPHKLEAIQPDFLVLACGAEQLQLPGLKKNAQEYIQAEDVICTPDLAGKNVVVVGGGLVGLEVAEMLVERGKSVTVLEATDQIAQDLNERERKRTLKRLWSQDIDILLQARFIEYRKSQHIVLVDRDGIQEELSPVDTVISAVGYIANPEELLNLSKFFEIPAQAIGDASKPRTAMEAIREGFEFGFNF